MMASGSFRAAGSLYFDLLVSMTHGARHVINNNHNNNNNNNYNAVNPVATLATTAATTSHIDASSSVAAAAVSRVAGDNEGVWAASTQGNKYVLVLCLQYYCLYVLCMQYSRFYEPHYSRYNIYLYSRDDVFCLTSTCRAAFCR